MLEEVPHIVEWVAYVLARHRSVAGSFRGEEGGITYATRTAFSAGAMFGIHRSHGLQGGYIAVHHEGHRVQKKSLPAGLEG